MGDRGEPHSVGELGAQNVAQRRHKHWPQQVPLKEIRREEEGHVCRTQRDGMSGRKRTRKESRSNAGKKGRQREGANTAAESTTRAKSKKKKKKKTISPVPEHSLRGGRRYLWVFAEPVGREQPFAERGRDARARARVVHTEQRQPLGARAHKVLAVAN